MKESTRCAPLGLKLCRGLPCTGIKSNWTEARSHTGRPSRPHFLPLRVHAAPRSLPGTLPASLDSGPSQLLTLLPADADTGDLWNACQILHWKSLLPLNPAQFSSYNHTASQRGPFMTLRGATSALMALSPMPGTSQVLGKYYVLCGLGTEAADNTCKYKSMRWKSEFII